MTRGGNDEETLAFSKEKTRKFGIAIGAIKVEKLTSLSSG